MVGSFCIYFNTTSVIYIIETNTIEAYEVLVFNGIQFKQPDYWYYCYPYNKHDVIICNAITKHNIYRIISTGTAD